MRSVIVAAVSTGAQSTQKKQKGLDTQNSNAMRANTLYYGDNLPILQGHPKTEEWWALLCSEPLL